MICCPPAPVGYVQFERCHYAGKWWFRTAPDQPWQLCRIEEPRAVAGSLD